MPDRSTQENLPEVQLSEKEMSKEDEVLARSYSTGGKMEEDPREFLMETSD